jgi:hypothetical protein
MLLTLCKLACFKVFTKMSISSSSTEVEHSLDHLKVEGSSPPATAGTSAHCYKTFYVSNLHMLFISLSVSLCKAFPT